MEDRKKYGDLHYGAITETLKTEKTDMCVAFDNVQDVATTRQVLLQISNWFKSKHRHLPLTWENPFNDEICNDAYSVVVQFMKDEREEELHRD